MRQGIIIFADAPAAGSPAEALLKATVEAARQTTGVTPFLAYGKAESSGPLRDLVGGPPPRFFPRPPAPRWASAWPRPSPSSSCRTTSAWPW